MEILGLIGIADVLGFVDIMGLVACVAGIAAVGIMVFALVLKFQELCSQRKQRLLEKQRQCYHEMLLDSLEKWMSEHQETVYLSRN